MPTLIRIRKPALIAVAFMIGVMLVTKSMAEDRALLIGVGQYQDSRINLPGIGLDINIMKDVTNLLGFKTGQVKILSDSESTLANVEKTMKNWLTNGVTKNDRVLIYFSGHGSRVPDDNGDESDGLDEVMVMHDVKVVERDGKTTLLNVFRDDEFNSILKSIPSKNILVFIDSCHSGSITKNLSLSPRSLGSDVEYASKFYYYEGIPEGSTNASKGDVFESKDSSDNYISVVAAQDDEQAVATSKGSIFTLGLREALRDAVKRNREITPSEVHRIVTQFVKDTMNPKKPFHPNILGSDRLANKSLLVAKLNGYGPTWKRLEKIVANAKPLSVSQNRSSYNLGDTLTITVDIPKSGYLNVVSVSSDDTATVLFPNQYQKSNKVDAGKLIIPTAKMNFDITAQEPLGNALTVAIVTQKPVDLYQESMANRNSKGDVTDLFGELSEFSLDHLEKGFGVTQRKQDEVLAGKILSDVRQ